MLNNNKCMSFPYISANRKQYVQNEFNRNNFITWIWECIYEFLYGSNNFINCYFISCKRHFSWIKIIFIIENFNRSESLPWKAVVADNHLNESLHFILIYISVYFCTTKTVDKEINCIKIVMVIFVACSINVFYSIRL